MAIEPGDEITVVSGRLKGSGGRVRSVANEGWRDASGELHERWVVAFWDDVTGKLHHAELSRVEA